MSGRLITDTSDFMAIDRGDEIVVGERRYSVIGYARERRFGIEDPKFWVKRVVDVENGERKIIKLAFYENFITTVGGIKVRCFRSPEKEGLILDLVRNHGHFMQGRAYIDQDGNNIRVLDVVRGTDYLVYLDTISIPHEEYTRTIMPRLLKNIIKAFEAIHFLHINGFRHGDIRNDHLYVEHDSGKMIWIDFDYDFEAMENPFSLDLFGLGNILVYTIGKGFHDHYSLVNDTATYGELIQRVSSKDFSILDKGRLMNLRKLYPYIPKTLNDVLLHFSIGAEVYYESAAEIIEDLNRCLHSVSE